jgi:hypothetical protein
MAFISEVVANRPKVKVEAEQVLLTRSTSPSGTSSPVDALQIKWKHISRYGCWYGVVFWEKSLPLAAVCSMAGLQTAREHHMLF